MSASLVRKALDETSFGTEEKLEQLSKASKKKFKPKSKKKKLSEEKTLKQNLNVLKALDYKISSKKFKTDNPPTTPVEEKGGRKKKKKEESSGGFTEEDFEKFEKEYFVS